MGEHNGKLALDVDATGTMEGWDGGTAWKWSAKVQPILDDDVVQGSFVDAPLSRLVLVVTHHQVRLN